MLILFVFGAVLILTSNLNHSCRDSNNLNGFSTSLTVFSCFNNLPMKEYQIIKTLLFRLDLTFIDSFGYTHRFNSIDFINLYLIS